MGEHPTSLSPEWGPFILFSLSFSFSRGRESSVSVHPLFLSFLVGVVFCEGARVSPHPSVGGGGGDGNDAPPSLFSFPPPHPPPAESAATNFFLSSSSLPFPQPGKGRWREHPSLLSRQLWSSDISACSLPMVVTAGKKHP